MPAQYWILKSEPDTFSFDSLVHKGPSVWDGVRNYQARNSMRDDMRVGDRVFFYHSGDSPSIVGTATIIRNAYPDPTSWDPKNPHYDPKSSPDNPRWVMVDLQFEKQYRKPLSLAELRKVKGLNKMVLLQKGSRLSVQPVTAKEFQIIEALAARQ